MVAGALLEVHIPEPPTGPAPGAGQFRRFIDPVLQLSTWRALVYLILFAFPLGLASFLVAVISWSVALAFVSAPIWYFATPEDNRGDVLWDGSHIDGGWEWAAIVGGGALLLFLAPWFVRALVSFDVLLMRALLGPTRGELERAAARSSEQRDLAVASASDDRRQIERDLHDGAQARLVSLAVDLGRARRRLEQGGSQEEAAELVKSAHEEAKLALVEIRDLARGIHPAVLTDRGLDAALSSLAARSTVPVTLTLGARRRAAARAGRVGRLLRRRRGADERRPPQRRRARSRLGRARRTASCVVEVRDDGAGGAEPTGLRPRRACATASARSAARSSSTARPAARPWSRR